MTIEGNTQQGDGGDERECHAQLVLVSKAFIDTPDEA